MNVFEPTAPFDRVVSVEMFEHMANWQPLLARIRTWLKPQGRLFLHIFTHPSRPVRYAQGDGNWMAQHFFTGGIMPTAGLIRQFPDLFTVEWEWRWSGTNYQRTAEQWLENFDATAPGSIPSCARSMAPTPVCGATAGACSSWPPPKALAGTRARSGASPLPPGAGMKNIALRPAAVGRARLGRAAEIASVIHAATPYGKGSYAFLLMTPYDAQLWTDAPHWSMEAPFALTLRYHMDFSTDDFVSRGLDEMKHVDPSLDAAALKASATP